MYSFSNWYITDIKTLHNYYLLAVIDLIHLTATYSTAQFKLDTRVPAHACVHTFHACESLKSCKILRVSPLLHADLSCALLQLNTRGTLDMHHTRKLVTNARLVYPQTHVAHHTKSSTRTHVSLSNTRGTPDMHHSNDLVTSEWFCNDSWHTRMNTSTMHTCAQKWSRAFSYINTWKWREWVWRRGRGW